jgi:hypothetical protein
VGLDRAGTVFFISSRIYEYDLGMHRIFSLPDYRAYFISGTGIRPDSGFDVPDIRPDTGY